MEIATDTWDRTTERRLVSTPTDLLTASNILTQDLLSLLVVPQIKIMMIVSMS